MQRLEARIPDLAGIAVKRAYLQALTTSGKVVEARNGSVDRNHGRGHGAGNSEHRQAHRRRPGRQADSGGRGISAQFTRLRMFAGPNGSGKSTIKDMLPPERLGVYVNADDIEKAIRPRVL